MTVNAVLTRIFPLRPTPTARLFSRLLVTPCLITILACNVQLRQLGAWRGRMRSSFLVAAGIAAGVSACASYADKIAPSYVSSVVYDHHLSCQQIGEEARA